MNHMCGLQFWLGGDSAPVKPYCRGTSGNQETAKPSFAPTPYADLGDSLRGLSSDVEDFSFELSDHFVLSFKLSL